MASVGAPQADPMISSSSRDTEMASKLQGTTSLTIRRLQEMTDDFSEQRRIGQGAYGKVYVAKLENGEEIAVKVLYNNTSGIDDEQFQHEFENLMRLEHPKIVRLVAYCYETQHQPMQYMGRTIFAEKTYRALCFEYMQNGSLEKHISDECDGIDWLTRYKIIKGTCQGLNHLHGGFSEPIYHLDLKPDNVLLDKNMVPKLAGFGLSKLFSDNQTMTTNSPIGTIGYLPMEFLRGNIISNKFDVFSLGVVMIKIIAGHGGYSKSAEMPRQEFLDQALGRASTQSLMNENFVKLETLTKSEVIPYAERADEYPILVRVTAPPWRRDEEMSRPGVDLVVVINSSRFTSINMDAMLMVINGLGSMDRLSIVSSDGDNIMELTFMSDNGRIFCRLMLEKLVGGVDGSSSVSDGNLVMSVGEGAKILREREAGEGDRRVGFIMVLLTFFEEEDDSRVDTLMSETISEFPVHVLDLTYYDRNAERGSYIADKNLGTYSIFRFPNEMEVALELFIGGITKVAATSIDIKLAAQEGVAISSIDSGSYISHVNSEGRSGEIHINDIYAGETKNFIVKLKLAEGKGKLVTIGGQYRNLKASKQLLPDMDVFVLRPHSGCSPEKLAMHPEVAVELVRLQPVKIVLSTLHDERIWSRVDLREEWEKIMSSEEGRRAPEEAMARLADDNKIIGMQGIPYCRQPFVQSWLSCHKWQRANTNMLTDSVAFRRKC